MGLKYDKHTQVYFVTVKDIAHITFLDCALTLISLRSDYKIIQATYKF